MPVKVNYIPFQENIGLLGMQGSGKTHRGRKILERLPSIPRLIISPQKPEINFERLGNPIEDIPDIKNGGAFLWVGELNSEIHERICDRVMNVCTNFLFVNDDVQEFCKKQKMPPKFERLIGSGRNRGISGMYLSPAPNRVHNTILQALSHIYAFRFNSEGQVKWLADNYFSNDAWLLLQKNLRKKEPFIRPDISFLPKGSFIYKKFTDTETQLYLTEACEKLQTDENEIEEEETVIEEKEEEVKVTSDNTNQDETVIEKEEEVNVTSNNTD